MHAILRHQRTVGNHALQHVLTSVPLIQRDSKGTDDFRSNLQHVAVGSKALSKGVMVWAMWRVIKGNSVVMSLSFTPYKQYRGKTIVFLQSMKETGGSEYADLDVLTYAHRGSKTDDSAPFHGAIWSNTDRKWIASGAPSPFRNQPGGPSTPIAYFFDLPMVYPGQTKSFETVAVIPETFEVLGVIRWGAKGTDDGAEAILPPSSEPSDRPTAGFLVAVDRFFETPSSVGPDPQRHQRYDAIIDRFAPDDATLTADQKKSLDPIAVKVKGANDTSLYVTVGGFADATEKDPNGISEARARAAGSHLVAQGVPKDAIRMDFFGAGWARFPPSAKEERNRRVQVRVHWGPSRP